MTTFGGTLTIGIDPGAGGGYCLIWPDGKAEAHAWGDPASVRDYIESITQVDAYDRIAVALELVGGYVGGAGNPGSAMFRFGTNYGFWQGLVMAYRLPLHLVRPQQWQAGIPGAKGKSKPERKRAIKAHAARIFPTLKPTLKTADAICIAEWARRNIT